jgi:hypothetical protein
MESTNREAESEPLTGDAPSWACALDRNIRARCNRQKKGLRIVTKKVEGLDTRVGGPPVYPYQPEQIWEALAITKERDFTYPASHGRDLYRRSLYSFWRRTVSPANMFDAANRQTCQVRGGTTCTPLHALTTLNDPTWVEASRVLAERAIKAAADVDGRLAFAFRRILGRRPTDYDMTAIRRMYERQLAVYQDDGDAAKQLLGIGESPRDETLDAAAHAAMSGVSSGATP